MVWTLAMQYALGIRNWYLYIYIGTGMAMAEWAPVI